VQCTIRTHTNQSISIFKKGKPDVKGREVGVMEYIVMERVITMPGQQWLIAGKILPKEDE
jgi:hypothetical protein